MKRMIAILLAAAMLLPLAISGLTLSAFAGAPTAGKYVITGGGAAGVPDYALNTTTYTGAELGTILASTEAADSGVTFNADYTASSGTENYVVELISVGSNFAIKLNNGQYLAAAGSTNLVSYKDYQTVPEAQWTVDVTDGVWSVRNVKSPEKYLGFSSTAHYFRTFTAGGVAPVLYRFTAEESGSTHEFSLQQSIHSSGAGSITATYGGRQYYFPEDADNTAAPTVFSVADNARVTLFFEPSEGSSLSKVRINGIETEVIPSGDGYALTLANVTSNTYVTAVWVNGEIDNRGDASTAVRADYDNPTYGLEGTANSDPITTAAVNEANILEGTVFTDKSVHYDEDNLSFTNTLSVNSVAYETATSESVVIPMDVVIILDISGSMNRAVGSTYRMQEIVDELNDLTDEIITSSAQNRVGLVTFSGGTSYSSSSNNAAIDVPLDHHTSIDLSYTNNNSGSGSNITLNGSLSIQADGGSAITKTVVGGTYTQTGIGKAYEMYAGLADKTVTLNGQEYERTPVVILVTDGCPTWASSSYTASTPGTSTYGTGSEEKTTAEGNVAYYTVRTAQYFRNQIKGMYDNNSRFRFYTVGVDMGSGTTFPGMASVVLNPTSENIAAMTTTGEPYNTFRTGLNSTDYKNEYYVDGAYVTYADMNYDVTTGSGALHNAFLEILTEAQAVVTHIMPLVNSTSVDFYDALGEDMEFKSAPILSYNGVDYAPTETITQDGQTRYLYNGFVQAYAGGPSVNLFTMAVTTEQDANGIWSITWSVPSSLVPAYIYDVATDAYIPAQTASLRYEVAPTDAALAAVTSPRTFESNYYDGDGYHAYATYQLNASSPFYNTYYGSLNPTLIADKLDNASETDEYIGSTTHADGVLTKQLGNNGTLTVSAKTADITVKKLWKNPDGTVRTAPADATVTAELWQRIDGTSEVLVEQVELSAANNWQYEWSDLKLRDEAHTYSYFGKEIAVSYADDYDYFTVEAPNENGELYLSNYYNRMTITVNTDWYYNGVPETDTYENRTVNTLYYKDATGNLVPVSSVVPIVFDSTGGNVEDWNDRWTDLPIRNADGTPIEYIVEQEIINEDLRGTHTTFYTVEQNERSAECDPITGIVNPDPVVQIDNYLENPPIAVTVRKVWADNSGSTQNDITVALYRAETENSAGKLIKSATFGQADGWSYTFDNLAPGYYYYVRETKVSGYTVTYSDPVCQAEDGNTPTVTVTNTPYPTTGLAVEKIWQTGSGTTLLDAGSMPPVKVKVRQIDHTVTAVDTYTVTVNFQGIYRYAYNTNNTKRTVATQKVLTNVPAGADVTLNFTNFNTLRLYSNNNNLGVALTSGDCTLDTSAFTHSVTSSGSTYSRRYNMAYGGSISVSDVRSDVVVTITNGYVYSTSTTFTNQTATMSYKGGDTPVDETTDSAYATLTLSADNDWHVSLDDLPTYAESGNTTHSYSYYLEEQTSSYDPVYTNNDTVHGITEGVVAITNTIYPEILPDTAVFDFGLPMNVDVLDNDRKSLNISGVTLTGVSTTAPSGVALNTGVSTAKKFGGSCGGTYGKFSVLDNQVRYTPFTTNVPGVDTAYYEILVPGVGYMYSRVDIAPATNVYYEQTFLVNSGFETLGTADSRVQSSRNILYGKDTAYAAYETDSLGSCYAVTVSDPLVQPYATFTFTGTGFDIISRSTPDSGVMVVEVHEDNASGAIARRFLTDNYLLEDSLYQLPVVHCTDLDYDTYFVKVIGYYNRIFDHNATAINTRGTMKLDGVLQDLGWAADDDYIYTPSSSQAAAKRSVTPAAAGSYNVYLDGVRIYNPLGTSPAGVGGDLYAASAETNPEYVQIRGLLLDANNWDSEGNEVVDGAMYIADGTETADPDDPFVTNGIYLSTSGILNTEVEDGKTYLLDKDGNRLTFEDEDVWAAVADGVRTFYHGETALTKQELNTLALSYYDNIYRANGPENEAYLADGNGIAFAVDANTAVHISAKSPNGQPVTLCVYDGTKWNAVAEITSATEMYYDLTAYTRSCGNNVIVKCVSGAGGILSLCQVKLLGGGAVRRTLHLNGALGYTAMQAMSGDEVIPVHTHAWTVTGGTANCTAGGTVIYTCTVCGKTRTADSAALGHSYELEAAPVVSCRGESTMVFTCAVCGSSVSRTLPSARHTYRVESLPQERCVLHECTACGFAYRVPYTPCEDGHTLSYTDNYNGMHTVTCTVCGQTYLQAHSFENGVCVCGAVRVDYAQLRISAVYLCLNENINLVCCVEVPADCSNISTVFTLNGKEYTVDEYTVDAEGRFCFEFTKITPQCMGDTVSATVYAERSGELLADTLEEYSVRTYCENMLSRCGDNTALRTLLSDLLVYGAAAQTFTGYKSDALVTDALELTPSSFPAQFSESGVRFEGTSDASLHWASAGLVLRSNLATRFTFTADSVDGLLVRVAVNGREQVFSALEFQPVEGRENIWYVEVSDISAAEFGDTVTASFLRGGETVGKTLCYSVNAYISTVYAADGMPALAQLVRALYCYGCSASAYIAD